MEEKKEKPVLPFTEVNPSMGERTKQEIWDEYMDFKEAVWDYFLYHEGNLKDGEDYKDCIYRLFRQFRQKHLSEALRVRLEGGLTIPKGYEEYMNPQPKEITD